MSFDARDAVGPIWTPAPIEPGHPLADGLLGLWLPVAPTDGGRMFYDQAGSNHHTLSAAAWRNASIEPGRTLTFSGTTQFTSGAGYELGTSFTLAAKFLSATTAAFRGVLGLTNAAKTRYELGMNGGGQAFFHYGAGSKSSTAPRIDDSNWHDVAGKYDGATTTHFTDGLPTPLGANAGTGGVATTASAMRFGDLAANGFYLNGQVAYGAVWSRPIADALMVSLPDLARRGFPGLIRRAPRTTTVIMAAPSGGPSIPVLMASYRRRRAG